MIRETIIPIIALLITTLALASVFAYYPLTITIVPQAPGVVFQAGSNAGKADINAGTITVTFGANYTNASVEIHPTYQENYYKDVLRIVNNGGSAMNVSLIFYPISSSLPTNSVVKLFVYGENTKVTELDITSPSSETPISVGTIGAGVMWQIDFYIKIPEGTYITGTKYQATASLVYTPSSEVPPVTPSSGR